MPIWMKELVVGPWFILAAFMVGVVGIVATLWTYWRAKPRRDLSYSTHSRCLLDHRGNPQTKLAVTYDGRTITTFTITRFVLWNRGTESLRRNDVAKGSPMTLKLLDGDVLEATIIKASATTNAFALNKLDDHTCSIDFEYIDPSEGMVAEIRHTAPTGDPFCVLGKLIGVRKIARRDTVDPAISSGPQNSDQ